MSNRYHLEQNLYKVNFITPELHTVGKSVLLWPGSPTVCPRMIDFVAGGLTTDQA